MSKSVKNLALMELIYFGKKASGKLVEAYARCGPVVVKGIHHNAEGNGIVVEWSDSVAGGRTVVPYTNIRNWTDGEADTKDIEEKPSIVSQLSVPISKPVAPPAAPPVVAEEPKANLPVPRKKVAKKISRRKTKARKGKPEAAEL